MKCILCDAKMLQGGIVTQSSCAKNLMMNSFSGMLDFGITY